jgi:4a-hydroxytetrahydrobiopterin dehydratase
MATKLTDEERAALMNELSDWSAVDGRDAIQRRFKFGTFNTAFSFMTAVAMKAEKLDHHPEWFNVYNRVEVVLTTHDCDGLSELDGKLARFMDKTAAKLTA